MTPVADGIAVVAVRTPTLAPATHTNTYVVGDTSLTIVDPASPYTDEQERFVQALIASERSVDRIVLTHHHHDHVSGVTALQAALGPLAVAAHRHTADRLAGRIVVDELLEDDDELQCGGRVLRAVFTPGHAPGHLVFSDTESGALIAGDMVAGIGTILIDEIDGDLDLYLDSLQRMRQLNASVLLPAHGPPLHQADAVLSFYIAHRHQRSEQVRQALSAHGACSAAELVPLVYTDLDPRAVPIAAVQLGSHLRWLDKHGVVVPHGQRYRLR